MKLHEFILSANSRKVRAVALELGITYETVPVQFWTGDHQKPAFLALNPNGKVPVLEDGDFVLWESHAIVCYFATKYGNGKLLPQDARGRAEVDRWLFWVSNHLDPAIGIMVYEKLVKPMMGQGDPDLAACERGLALSHKFLAVLDAWLESHEYVAGPLTVADFAVAAHLAPRDIVGLDIGKYTHLQAWAQRIESRESWTKSDPNHDDE